MEELDEVCDFGVDSQACSDDCLGIELNWTCPETAVSDVDCSYCGDSEIQLDEQCDFDSDEGVCIDCSEIKVGFYCEEFPTSRG